MITNETETLLLGHLFSLYSQMLCVGFSWYQNKTCAAIVNMLLESFHCLRNQLWGIRTLPKAPTWSSQSYLVRHAHWWYGNYFCFNELYMSSSSPSDCECACECDMSEVVVLRQMDPDHCICRIVQQRDTIAPPLTTDDVVEESTVRFFAVEYVHPSLKTSLSLALPPNIYMTDNQILSPVFVKRLLECSFGAWVEFDMRYTLHVVDQDICIFTLHSHQYIRLEKNTYTIKHLL
jgi:hypothetical protein